MSRVLCWFGWHRWWGEDRRHDWIKHRGWWTSIIYCSRCGKPGIMVMRDPYAHGSREPREDMK